MTKRPVARVLPDSRLPQLDRLFDYTIPDGLVVEPGVRVKVPMGKGGRVHTGYVVELASQSDYEGTLNALESVTSPVPVLTPELYSLANAVAQRSAGGVSDVLRLAIPPRAVRVERQWLEHTPKPLERPAPPSAPENYSKATWEGLYEAGNKSWLQLDYGLSHVDSSWVPRGHDDIARLAATVVSTGRGAVVCLPDWRDVDLFESCLRWLLDERFFVRFDPQHTPSERYRSYLRTLESEPVIAYGSRHVIYAPVFNLGLIVVAQDGDDSHREPLAPYPMSRDIALIRAEQSGAAVVMASQLPSMEASRLLGMGYLSPARPQKDHRPRVVPTALGRSETAASTPARLPSIAFQAARAALDTGPVLVQVFHAGYSAGLACAECGGRARCHACGGPLRSPQRGGSPGCPWCGQFAPQWACPDCHSHNLKPIGQGLGRTSSELGKAFPGVPIVQSDGDNRLLSIPDRPALVVATRGAEPVAAGGYQAALLLDGDAMLQRAALDALDDALAAWEWALGLLAPGAMAYLTDLDGPIAQAVASGAIEALLQKEFAQRRALRMPPAVRVASILGPRDVVEALVNEQIGHPEVDALGPFPADGASRALLRMSYRQAPGVAAELRAAVVRHASESGRRQSRLKVVMDDVSTLDLLASGAL